MDSDSDSVPILSPSVSCHRGPSTSPTSRDFALRTLKSNFGRLWGDQRLADLTIHVRLKPTMGSSTPAAAKDEK